MVFELTTGWFGFSLVTLLLTSIFASILFFLFAIIGFSWNISFSVPSSDQMIELNLTGVFCELGAFVNCDIQKGQFFFALFMCEFDGWVYSVDYGCELEWLPVQIKNMSSMKHLCVDCRGRGGLVLWSP